MADCVVRTACNVQWCKMFRSPWFFRKIMFIFDGGRQRRYAMKTYEWMLNTFQKEIPSRNNHSVQVPRHYITRMGLKKTIWIPKKKTSLQRSWRLETFFIRTDEIVLVHDYFIICHLPYFVWSTQYNFLSIVTERANIIRFSLLSLYAPHKCYVYMWTLFQFSFFTLFRYFLYKYFFHRLNNVKHTREEQNIKQCRVQNDENRLKKKKCKK